MATTKLPISGGVRIAAGSFGGTDLQKLDLSKTLSEIWFAVWRSGVNALAIEANEIRQTLMAGAAAGRVGLQPLAGLTRAKRQLGKRAGVTPATPTFTSRAPLLRGGEMAFAPLTMHRRTRDPFKNVDFTVEFQRGVKGMDGRPLAAIAAMNEFGVTITVPITGPQRRFLWALSRGTAGPPGGPASPANPPDKGRTEGVRAAVIPPRRVWRNTFDVAMRQNPEHIIDLMIPQLAVAKLPHGLDSPIHFTSGGKMTSP